jgi:hypothetical protein
MFPEGQLILRRRVKVVLRDRLHRYRRRRQKKFISSLRCEKVCWWSASDRQLWTAVSIDKTCFKFHFFDFHKFRRFFEALAKLLLGFLEKIYIKNFL